ncbi:MAG TPA: RNA polymerase sigma factor [Chthoniobacterales bacterium]|nr:RNA polymerase sigma factor [Chthoniobacterales bacterium]
MEADPDAELMLRLKNGEDRILNELMTRWQQPLVAFIYRYIGRETEALDLAQETFVRVYATRRRYTVRGKFSTWLFGIAANLCRNHLRWRRRRGESVPETSDMEDAEFAERIQSLDDSPDQAAIRSESISLIKVAIDKLPHDLKTVILLYEYQSLSYGEISSVLGCSVKAVEMKLYRARHLLRERLLRHDLR